MTLTLGGLEREMKFENDRPLCVYGAWRLDDQSTSGEIAEVILKGSAPTSPALETAEQPCYWTFGHKGHVAVATSINRSLMTECRWVLYPTVGPAVAPVAERTAGVREMCGNEGRVRAAPITGVTSLCVVFCETR